MFKITVVLSLLLIGTLWAAGLSCDSCGSECTPACGTKHFRSCCFNYLRRKRGHENFKLWTPIHDLKMNIQKPKQTDMPEWINNVPSDYEPYFIDDAVENRMQVLYDA